MSMVPDIRPGAPLSLRALAGAAFAGPIDLDLTGYGCLLGPADGGGGAVLRAIAGLDACRGQVALGHSLDGVAPARRRIGLLTRGGGVALPHRPLAVSLGRAMAARGIPAGLHAARIGALADEFGLDAGCVPADLPADGLLRARLAEALAADPALLLLDDVLEQADDADALIPLLRELQRRRQMTVLHALRRRADAFALADHLVLMRGGRVLRQGPPLRLYETPGSVAVACCTGAANVLRGTLLEQENDVASVRLACGPVVEADPPAALLLPGADCALMLRPERIAVSPVEAATLGGAAIPGVLKDLVHAGDVVRMQVAIGTDIVLSVLRPAVLADAGLRVGAAVSVAWQSRHAALFPAG